MGEKRLDTLKTLAIIAVAGLIVLGGWYIWQNSTNNTPLSERPSPSSTAADSSKTKNAQEFSQAEIAQAPAKIVTFSELSADLQEILVARVKKQSPQCVKNDTLIDAAGRTINPQVKYASVGSAIVAIECDSAAAGLFAKDKSGKWIYVESTQEVFSCDSVFSYPVPKKLLELDGSPAACLEKSTNQRRSYDEALQARYY